MARPGTCRLTCSGKPDHHLLRRRWFIWRSHNAIFHNSLKFPDTTIFTRGSSLKHLGRTFRGVHDNHIERSRQHPASLSWSSLNQIRQSKGHSLTASKLRYNSKPKKVKRDTRVGKAQHHELWDNGNKQRMTAGGTKATHSSRFITGP